MKNNNENVKVVLSSEQFTKISDDKNKFLRELRDEIDSTTVTIEAKKEELEKIKQKIKELENKYSNLSSELSEEKKCRRSLKFEIYRQGRIAQKTIKLFTNKKPVNISGLYPEIEKKKKKTKTR